MSTSAPAQPVDTPAVRTGRLNQALIGAPAGLQQLQTPLLAVDLPVMDRNIAKMARLASAAGVQLRPHAKTHKCSAIARRQLAAGAIGICTATVGEAEAMVAAGITNILITSPAIGPGKAERVVALQRIAPELMVVVDAAPNLAQLAALAAAAGQTVPVMVGLDIGSHREGARTVEDAVALVASVDAASHLSLAGLFAYAGHVQHIDDYAQRSAAMATINERLQRWKQALGPERATSIVLSGGGTGSALIDANGGLYTELQVGSYMFMDGEYGAIETEADGKDAFEQSLWVLTRVIGVNHEGFVTTDAGIKRFSMGSVDPVVFRGAPAGSTYAFQGDEHGMIRLPEGASPPSLGALVWVRPPHCDPTVNLYDDLHVLDGDRLVDIWAIEGRGVV